MYLVFEDHAYMTNFLKKGQIFCGRSVDMAKHLSNYYWKETEYDGYSVEVIFIEYYNE